VKDRFIVISQRAPVGVLTLGNAAHELVETEVRVLEGGEEPRAKLGREHGREVADGRITDELAEGLERGDRGAPGRGTYVTARATGSAKPRRSIASRCRSV
jgi:hypothetical protein